MMIMSKGNSELGVSDVAGEEREHGKKKNKALSLKEYMKRIPPPPKEHEHELKMERLLKRMLEKSERLLDDELRYYSRQIMLKDIGYEGQLKLKNARICLVGLGGLGSTVATQLAAMGVGHLRLVDRDVVEISNLQRQHLYSYDVLGHPKVEAAVNRLKKLNPYVKFEPIPVSFNKQNAEELVRKMDAVVDGLDNMNTRYAVNRACVKLGVPYVFGSAISTFGNASTIIPRKTACLECFYGKLSDRLLPTCGAVGVHPSVISIVASVEAAETIRILLGKQPALTNRLLYCDLDSMQFEEISITRAETCPVCGSHPSTKPSPLRHVLVEEGCGRNKKRVFTVVPKENLDLDLGRLAGILKQESVNLHVQAEMGLTFAGDNGMVASLLSSGVMVVEGGASKEKTLKLYREIVVQKMGVPWSRIR